MLPKDECGASGRTTLLGVCVGEERSLTGDTVNIGCPVAHHAQVVGADVVNADIVTPDDQDIGLLGLRVVLCTKKKCQYPDGDKIVPQRIFLFVSSLL